MPATITQLEGSQAQKPFKYVPITTFTWFTGLVTQRSPFSPYDTRYNVRYIGGRPDMLIDGLNMELNNKGTLQRRPGTSLYSSGTLDSGALTFYSFHQTNTNLNPIQIIADTSTKTYTVTPSGVSSFFTKSNGAGQSYFQGVGNVLYFGNGIDLKAWAGSGSTRNWGIAMNNVASTVGPNGCGTGTDVAIDSGTPWLNPGNITADDGSFATVTLPAPTQGQTTIGPNGPTIAGTSGSGTNTWSNPNNIKVLDGAVASVNVLTEISTSNLLFGTGYNFGIPSNATIDGITVTVYGDSGFPINVYGSTSELWGTTWTPSDINDPGFGFQFGVSNNGDGAGGFAIDTTAQLLKANSPVGTNEAHGGPVSGGFLFMDVDFISISVTYTIPSGNTTLTDLLSATNFGFALSSANTISGILVEIKGVGNAQPTGTSLSVQILGNGSGIGTAKTGIVLNGTNTFISLGGNSDTWGTTFSPGVIDSTTFGVSIQGVNSGSASGQWSIDFVRITIYGTGGPIIAVSGSAGSFSATAGYEYVYSYGNSSSGHVSNPTPPSASTGIFTNKANVSVSLTASTDPQVNQIRVFRTKDGGSTFFELPTSPYPNTTGNITDSSSDANLNLFSFWQSSPTYVNNPPPAGFINLTYHLNRIWGSVGTLVYFSGGPLTLLGNGNEAFPPTQVFAFPSTVVKLLPISSGLIVFTTDDTWIIVGNTVSSMYSEIFQQGLGLLSWNALDVIGNTIFLYTSDRMFLSLGSTGNNEIGFAIGDKLEVNYDPDSSYVAALVSGTSDKAVFISDGVSSWYRCNWNQPPEGGPAWSPQATITGGITSIVSVETSPGNHQLLMGTSSGNILTRNLSVFTDNGSTYAANVTMGSIILAQPGQLAEINSIITWLNKTGSVPSVSILLDEVTGSFESLPSPIDTPALLPPSGTIYAKRYYISTAQPNVSAFCQSVQINISFPAENFKNELLAMSIYGKLNYSE